MKIIEPDKAGRDEAYHAIHKAVRARYEEKLQRATWWQWIVLSLAILRETNREMKRRFPPTHLHLHFR